MLGRSGPRDCPRAGEGLLLQVQQGTAPCVCFRTFSAGRQELHAVRQGYRQLGSCFAASRVLRVSRRRSSMLRNVLAIAAFESAGQDRVDTCGVGISKVYQRQSLRPVPGDPARSVTPASLPLSALSDILVV